MLLPIAYVSARCKIGGDMWRFVARGTPTKWFSAEWEWLTGDGGLHHTRELDRRVNRAGHAAMARRQKRQIEKRRAENAVSVKRKIERTDNASDVAAAALDARTISDIFGSNLPDEAFDVFDDDWLRPADERIGGIEDDSARPLHREDGVPADVKLGADCEDCDTAFARPTRDSDIALLLREMRETMATKADLAALRAEMRSWFGTLRTIRRGTSETTPTGDPMVESDPPSTPAKPPDETIARCQILRLALAAFGSKSNMRRWLFEPGNWALDYQVPAVLLQTAEGRKMLENFLIRLEFGAYQ